MAEIPQLGHRGGGWVVLQLALIWATVVLGVTGSRWPGAAGWWLKGAGILVAVAGAVVFAAAVRTLGAGMTQFPRPKESGALVDTGPYAVVRHPIYSGAILFLVGISLVVTPWMLLGAAALAVVWGLKARVEERFLLARYPGYPAYCEQTCFRLVPFVY